MVFPEDVEDTYHNHMLLLFGLAAEKEYVIHIDGHDSLNYDFLKMLFIIV